MSLLEQEATRMAAALDDYDHVSVTDIGGWGPIGFWLVVRDERFDISYEMASHCDYWDFIAALVDHRHCVCGTPSRRWRDAARSGLRHRAAASRLLIAGRSRF